MSAADLITLDEVEQINKKLDGMGGGDPIEAFYKVLRDPALTVDMVEAFSSTDAGFAAWSDLQSVPTLMAEEPIISYIKGSPSAYLGAINNTTLIAQLGNWTSADFTVTSPTALAIVNLSEGDFLAWVAAESDGEGLFLVVASADAMQIIAANDVKMTAFAGSNWCVTQAITTSFGISALVGSMAAMVEISENTTALAVIFGDIANRTILWDAGKDMADQLLRVSATSRQWLLDNIAATNRRTGPTKFTLNKKCYYLRLFQKDFSDSEAWAYAGDGVGDYNTGEWGVSYNVNVWTEINERVSPMTQRQTDARDALYTDAVYVEME